MKYLFTILFCAAFSLIHAQESELDIKSTIKQVTLFLEGAQVTRQAQFPIKTGVSILEFNGISPSIQEQSIQVEGSSGVKILSVSFSLNYLEGQKRPEKIASLENERKRLTSLIQQERSMQAVFTEEESILITNKSIGGTDKGVQVAELKVAMDYFRQRLSDIKQQQLQTERNIQKYNEELIKVDAQLKEMSSAKTQPTGEITVKVSAKASTQADMKVKYLVDEARWFPSYDIRAINVKSPVSIAYKANIAQQSGEDWKDVELTISSGNPTQVGARPVIRPWLLGFNNAVYQHDQSTISSMDLYGSRGNSVQGKVMDSNGEGLPGVNVMIKGTTVGTTTDAEGNYSLMLTSDAQSAVFSFVGYQSQEILIQNRPVMDVALSEDVTALNEVVVTGYANSPIRIRGAASLSGRMAGVQVDKKKSIVATPVIRQTNVEFVLDEPFSIKSDGEVRTTEMVEYELDALYEYYCVPKLETDAFLIAKVMNWDEYNFLEGEANLFFEGKYIGKSIMDTRNTSDTLTLSLGRDPNVLVTREKVKDLSSKQFVGSNQKATVAYDISIRNKKALPITIIIEDQIPVATTKEISIDKIEDSNGEYNEETGMIKWRKEIAPGKTEKLQLKYAVRYPKSSVMILE